MIERFKTAPGGTEMRSKWHVSVDTSRKYSSCVTQEDATKFDDPKSINDDDRLTYPVKWTATVCDFPKKPKDGDILLMIKSGNV